MNRSRIFATCTCLLAALFTLACSGREVPGDRSGATPVQSGAERLIDNHLQELRGKRIGLLMNPTSRVDGTHMLDTLLARNIDVTALFASEHGFRGEAGAGEEIIGGVDSATGIPVHSLYGEVRHPTPEMLDSVDLILADLPDVGARFYTYSAALGNVLESVAGTGIPVWVLDRPNPAGGDYVAGWIIGEQYESYVGAFPVPMIHGLTLGELARMMVGEGWIDYEEAPGLRVISMSGWERGMTWDDTGMEWIPPSPNLPRFENAFIYLGTVLFEGTTMSEGRGTDDPFLTVGAPSTGLSDEALRELGERFPGAELERVEFTPRSIPGKAPNPKHEGVACRGVKITLTGEIDPLSFGLALLDRMLAAAPDAELVAYMQNLTGISNERLREVLESGDYPSDWSDDVQAFRELRKPYLLY